MDSLKRNTLKTACCCAAGLMTHAAGAAAGPGVAQASAAGKAPAKVYFSRHIDAEHLIELYKRVSADITGRVAIKLHTGERHGPNILPRDMVKAFQAQIPGSTIVETNTLYKGDRYTTEDHRKTLEINGWTFCPVDIMDEEGTVNLPVKGGRHFTEVSMGGPGLTHTLV